MAVLFGKPPEQYAVSFGQPSPEFSQERAPACQMSMPSQLFTNWLPETRTSFW